MTDPWEITVCDGGEATLVARPPTPRMPASPQQLDFYEELISGTSHVVLEARAGTGKSTSCREAMWRLLDRTPGLAIRYCCFNKKIADEFEAKCPSGVEVGTMHRFGLQALIAAFGSRVDKNKSYTILDGCGGAELKGYYRRAIVKLVSLAKNHGLRPEDPGLPLELDAFVDHYDVECYRERGMVLGYAEKVLAHSAAMTSLVDFDDMLWLTVLHPVRFPSVDFLFIDELQDLNPVQHAMAERLSDSGRTVGVGDPFQCQPAGTLVRMTGGALKAIEDIREGDEVVSFDRHASAMVGRVSQGRKVTATASRPFTGFMLTVRAGCETACTPNHKWVARFVERSTEVFVTYLMKRGDRFRVGWCQLFTKDGSLHLGYRARIEKADGAWILGVHDNRTDASVQESILAARYGMPTVTFEPVDGAQHLTREAIDRIFSELNSSDMVTRANSCLQYFGRDIRHPFYTVDLQQRQGRSTIFVTQACNLVPGLMMVPVYTGEKEPRWTTVTEIKGTFVSGLPVFSLEVEGNKTYVADGLVTHNSIYAFRGADPDSIPRFIAKLDAKVLPLTVTFRCPRSHVALARKLVGDFEAAPNAPEGTLSSGDKDLIDLAGAGDMVLCRANAPIIQACLRQIANLKPAIVRGRAIGDSLLAVVRKVGDAPTIPDFARNLGRWRAKEVMRLEAKDGCEDLVEQVMDKASSLDAIASACSSPAEIPAAIQRLFADDDAESRVTFSTVHRAKGSEARNVTYIQIPYSEKRDKARPPREWEKAQRRNLRYVALTRSLDTLTLVT